MIQNYQQHIPNNPDLFNLAPADYNALLKIAESRYRDRAKSRIPGKSYCRLQELKRIFLLQGMLVDSLTGNRLLDEKSCSRMTLAKY